MRKRKTKIRNIRLKTFLSENVFIFYLRHPSYIWVYHFVGNLWQTTIAFLKLNLTGKGHVKRTCFTTNRSNLS